MAKYKIIQDTTITYGQNPAYRYTKTLSSGDVIEGVVSPYGGNVIITTIYGENPDLEMTGISWLNIPVTNVEQVSESTPIKLSNNVISELKNNSIKKVVVANATSVSRYVTQKQLIIGILSAVALTGAYFYFKKK